ncbi:MAG: hypothetical protein EPO68_10570 [Planctomycetota bacterium]|nr:MAG: hypothetical protein EPO68_10570 [Planctomycetota bacterium]
MQDVPEYVRRKGLAFPCYMDARKPAQIDAAHCVRLNWEAFFFSDLYERERFLSDVFLYCGLLTDPISRKRFHPGPDSPRYDYEGVAYYFEDARNRAAFESDPKASRLPGLKMQ